MESSAKSNGRWICFSQCPNPITWSILKNNLTHTYTLKTFFNLYMITFSYLMTKLWIFVITNFWFDSEDIAPRVLFGDSIDVFHNNDEFGEVQT
jgi:hypothetical protein